MKNLIKIPIVLIIIASISSCMKDDIESLSNDTFNGVISSGGIPEKVEEKVEVVDSTSTQEVMDDGTIWYCTTRTLSVVDGNSDFPLFNPNASVIYPGSLLQGKTLTKASPSVIPVMRAGGTVSIDIIDGSAQPAFTVDEVTKSNIAEAANAIIGESAGIVTANFNFTYEEVHSQEQLALSLGLEFENQFVEISSGFSFDQSKSFNRYIVKLNQSFYTLSFDIPTSANDIFGPEVTPEQLSQYIGPGNPATFISDVTYGRIYYMLIESTSQSTEIQAQLSASFQSVTAGGSIEADVNHLRSLDNLQIKVVAFGGEAGSTLNTLNVTEEGLHGLVSSLAESTDIRTGVPISYVVRSAVDKEVVSVKLATEYDVKECIPLTSTLGNPAAWWAAYDLDLQQNSQNPCFECFEYDGTFKYFLNRQQGWDAFAADDDNPEGMVVTKWRDISNHGNDLNAEDPKSRPLYIEDAFPNGTPAVEFYQFKVGNTLFRSQLRFNANDLIGSDYTILAVASYKNRVIKQVKLQGEWRDIFDQPNGYGNFVNIEGGSGAIKAGLSSNATLEYTHDNESISGNISYPDEGQILSKEFKVYAVTFSQTEGTAIYENGLLIDKNPNATSSLDSYNSAFIGIFKDNEPGRDPARVRIGEIRIYDNAATEHQIQQETESLKAQYGF